MHLRKLLTTASIPLEQPEGSMTQRFYGKWSIVLCAAVFGWGCGSAKVEVNTADGTKPASKPFDAPLLAAGGGSSRGGQALSEDDERLEVPGSQFGDAPPVQTAKKGKKGKKGKKASAPVIPYTDAIAEQMEGLEWGMTWKKVTPGRRGK
jgi:hypothetical protein